MTVILFVLNLLLNSTQIIVTDNYGKVQIEQSSEYIILDDINS